LDGQHEPELAGRLLLPVFVIRRQQGVPLFPYTTLFRSYDVYMRAGGVTTLISTSNMSPNSPVDAFYRGSSADGSKVFFETSEALTASDTNPRTDVYMRQGSTTSLVSTGPTSAPGTSSSP